MEFWKRPLQRAVRLVCEKRRRSSGYAERILDEARRDKRRKVGFSKFSKYRSTAHVLPTSNLCERLFSLAKLILTDLRQNMNPSTLNDILFLKSNRRLWNANLIQEIWNEHGDQPDVVIHEWGVHDYYYYYHLIIISYCNTIVLQ